MPSDSGVTSSSSMSALPEQDIGLHRGAQRDHFVGVQFGVRLAAEQLLDRARTSGMRVEPPTSTTSSICSGFEAGVLERLPAWPERAVDDRSDQLVEFCARDLALIVLPPVAQVSSLVRIRRDRFLAWMTALRIVLNSLRPDEAGHAIQLAPRCSRSTSTLERSADRCRRRRDACRRWWRAPRRCRLDSENRNVERAAAEVVDGDHALLRLSSP